MGTDKIIDMPGLHWFCSFCDPTAAIKLEQVKNAAEVHRINNEQPNTSGIDAAKETNLYVNLPPETISTADSPTNTQQVDQNISNKENSNPEDTRPICLHYRRNGCRHGLAGNACAYRHPKQCKRYTGHGTDKKMGCQKGTKCELFHPMLCRNSLTKRECYNEGCRFIHCKGTKRNRSPNNLNSQQPTYVQPTYNLANKHEFPTIVPATATTSIPPPQQQSRNEISFLGVLNQIQQQLKIMESTQQQQALQIQEMIQSNKAIQMQAQPVQIPSPVPMSNPWTGQNYIQSM